MPEATFHFPRGFLWGTATSSYQVEGKNHNNNWYSWEQQPGRILNGHTAGMACDWWGGRWREDFDRAAESGQNAHRLSIEWSRIQPAPGRWDEHALDHYRQIAQGLQERSLLPMVTLHHFTDPLWLTEQGGWEREMVVDVFNAYVEKVVQALKGYVRYWVPINEPNVYAINGYVLGDFPPGRHNLDVAIRVIANMVRAHAAAYETIHHLQPEAQVGTAINYRDFLPAKTWSPFDRWVTNITYRSFNTAFLDALATGKFRMAFQRQNIPAAKGRHDFVGVNYYTREYISFSLMNGDQLFSKRFYRPDAELSETGFFANEPLGFYRSLENATQYGLPIFVTENGVEDKEDQLRPRYLVEHVHQLWRAVNFNWPIKGYFHWSLVDNFEWERGWTQRFGLWELDPATQTRRKRASAALFQEICEQNGLSSAMVQGYAPQAYPDMFPG